MRNLLFFLAALVCCSAIRAQSSGAAELRERVYIQTDKDHYLSGELVWMKWITTTEKGLPLAFSKVGYVELVDEQESRARVKIDLSEGVGSGTILLPSTLPTGYYRLVGYTRYMRNEGAAVYFEKWIGVVNPIAAEVPRGGATTTPPDLSSEPADGGRIAVSGDRTVYTPRSEVCLELSGIPDDIHTLSLSVTYRGLTGRFPSSGLGTWKTGLSENAPPSPLSGEYEAEYEGQIVTGKLISTETGDAFHSRQILPLAAFSGDNIHLFGGKIDEAGGVTFHTSRTTGFSEIVTTMRGNNGIPCRIDVDDPYTRESLTQPTPTFPLGDINRETMLRQSLAMQMQYSYVNDSLNRLDHVAPHFFYRPDRRYLLEEWRRFATMQEVMTEFVVAVGFRRIDGKRYLTVMNEDYGFAQAYSLVLLDGIPIIDHDIIYNYNPLLLSRIDVFYDRFVVGNLLFNGIVALYTEQNNFPELLPDPFTQILPYDSPQSHRRFFAPDYTDESRKASRLPDYRHTLYWNADIEADERGKAAVSFSASDLTGSYQVLVEGLTKSGEVVQSVYPIEVR